MNPSFQKIKNRLSKSKFLAPIIAGMSIHQLFLFIVLLGVLPGIADFSLFSLEYFSELEFFIGDATPLTNTIHWLPIILLPIALYILFQEQKYWWIIGLLPSFFILFMKLSSNFKILEAPEVFSFVLSILYKVALIFFVINGNVRSIAFVVFSFFIAFLVSIQQLILFAALTFLLRFIYLVLSQNVKIFSGIKGSKLLLLSLKTLLLWSPILLFAIPYRYFTHFLTEVGKEMIYDNGIVDRHNVYTDLTIDELIENYRIEKETTVKTLLEKYDFSTYDASNIQQNVWKSLVYLKPTIDSIKFDDYREVVEQFKKVYLTLDATELPTASSLFMLKYMMLDLEKIAIRKKFWGKSELELDIELTIYNRLARKQEQANKGLLENEAYLSGSVDQGLNETDTLLGDFIQESTALTARLQNATAENRASIEEEGRQLSKSSKQKIDNKLDGIHDSFEEEINQIPKKTMSTFDSALPPKLTQINSSFANSDCGFLDVKCGAVNLMKGLLRSTYASQRKKARASVAKKAENTKNIANEKVDNAVEGARTDAHAVVDQTEEKMVEAAQNAEKGINQAGEEVREEMEKQAKEGTELVKGQLASIKEPIVEATEKVQSSVEEGVNAVNEATKNTILAVNQYLLFSKLMSIMGFIFLLISSYLYVFSRVAFGEDHDLFVSLREKDTSSINGQLVQHGASYSIPADHSEAYFVSRKFEPTGRAPKVAVPYWPISIGARLLSGAYIMNEIKVREANDESVDFRSVAGAEFVEWILAEEEEVIFSYEQFVAMSESIQLSTHISLRFTTLLMGRPFFYIAKGPGSLVLMTKGVPITNSEEELVRSVSAGRVIAWQKNTLFSVDSELNLLDVYLSSLYLKRSSDDLIIIDADDGYAKNKTGLFRFVLRFFLPI